MKKFEIISLKLQGWSNSKIQKNFSVSRNTIRKYWNEYQLNLDKLSLSNPDIDTSSIIEEIVSDPHYDTSNRASRKYNEEIDSLLNQILEDERNKKKRLGSNKQMLTKKQIYELVIAKGFNISETTIRNKIREKLDEHKEVFIKQEYKYGERFEYDFGEVKLIIDSKHIKAYLACITLPASNFRYAYLYHNSKMDVFLDSQTRFFEMIGGCFKEGVYDNMRNVVSKFIGRNEKQLNEQLIKLATYYGFRINVTNCFSGNEKGSVEESVKFIRNKVFAIKYQFNTFEEAEKYLEDKLIELNKSSKVSEEQKYLTAYRPKYEVANIVSLHVNSYSFIQVDTNFYSVPEGLVDKYVTCKIYPNTIDVYYKNELLTKHNRVVGKNKTCIDIKHYLNTFLKKPGAINNSKALNSIPKLKSLFDTYFKDNPKKFIEFLITYKDLSIEEIIDIITVQRCINKQYDNNTITSNTKKQINEIIELFIKGKENKYVH